MHFIGRHIEATGLILLLSFATAAAAIYFELPKKWQNAAMVRPVAAQSAPDGCAHPGQGCCSSKEGAGAVKSEGGGCSHSHKD